MTADEDIIKTITLAGTDKDGDPLTYNITTLPANGTLFQTSDGTTKGDTITSVPTTVSDASHRVIYLSAIDGNGDGHGNFGFKVNDGTIDSDETIVIVNVTKVNDAVIAVSQVVNVNEDINKTITLAATDVDGDTTKLQNHRRSLLTGICSRPAMERQGGIRSHQFPPLFSMRITRSSTYQPKMGMVSITATSVLR